ncbi:MAG: DUF2169 domain-containing protein [Candidatus Binataceae bacterium]
MKIVKPQRLGLLYRSYQDGERCYLAATVAAFLPFENPQWLLPEAAMWKTIAAELGKDGVLDLGMPKTRGEVLIKGACFSPAGRPTPALQVRFQLGSIDKRLYVFGDRFWRRGAPSEPAPFTRMDISWRNAFGGAAYAQNPIGKGVAPVTDKNGLTAHPLPNIEDPAHLIGSPGDRPAAAASFEPYDFIWPQRFSKTGTYDARWFAERFPGFAADMDWAIFNAAPADQQLQRFFQGGESFEISGMHPSKPLVSSRVTDIAMRCFINRKVDGGESFEEIRTVPETLWLFPHLERAVVLFRGIAAINTDDAADVLQIIAGAEAAGQPKPASHYQEVLSARLDRANRVRAMRAVMRESDLMPPEQGVPPGVIPEDENELQALIASKGLLRKHQRAGAEKRLESAKAQLLERREAMLKQAQQLNLPPPDTSKIDEALAQTLPPESEPVSLENLDLDKIRADAEATKADALARFRQAEEAARARCTQLGVDYDQLAAQAKVQAGGPPKFSAARQLEQLAALSQSLKARGLSSEKIDSQLAEPDLREKLTQAEQRLRETYRKFAHHFPPVMPLPAERAAAVKARVAEDRKQGKSFAGVDLTGADLSGMDLRGADFREALMEAANLSNSDLGGADFSGAVLARARLVKAKLGNAKLNNSCAGGADFTGATVNDADFTGATLAGAVLAAADFTGARMDKVDFLGAKPSNADFSAAHLEHINFIDSDFSGAKFARAEMERVLFLRDQLNAVGFEGAKMRRVSFLDSKLAHASFADVRTEKLVFTINSTLPGADFSRAGIEGASLRDANLEEAKLVEAKAANADFSGANLKRADFQRADLSRLRTTRSDLSGSNLDGANLFEAVMHKAILSGASIRAANMYRADVLHATLDQHTDLAGSNLKRTLLKDWKPR